MRIRSLLVEMHALTIGITNHFGEDTKKERKPKNSVYFGLQAVLIFAIICLYPSIIRFIIQAYRKVFFSTAMC